MKTIHSLICLTSIICWTGSFATAGSDRLDVVPNNPNASKATHAVLRYLAALSEGSLEGVIVGQNCGHAGTMVEAESIMGYPRLVQSLHAETGKWVGLLSVDYEHNETFTPAALSAANRLLIDHWNAGGLVAVGWSPPESLAERRVGPDQSPG